MTELHALYRFFSDTNKLLYIGITLDPVGRFKSHKSHKTWWTEIKRITFEYFQTRDDLRAAEEQAIKRERPLYNFVYNAAARTKTVGLGCCGCGVVLKPKQCHVVLESLRVVCMECASNSSSKKIHAENYPSCPIRWHDIWDHDIVNCPSREAAVSFINQATHRGHGSKRFQMDDRKGRAMTTQPASESAGLSEWPRWVF